MSVNWKDMGDEDGRISIEFSDQAFDGFASIPDNFMLRPTIDIIAKL